MNGGDITRFRENVNSAGIFKVKYSKNKNKVNSLPTVGDSTSTDAIGVNHGHENGATVTSENSPLTSGSKGTENISNVQGTVQENIPLDKDGERDYRHATPKAAAKGMAEEFELLRGKVMSIIVQKSANR